MVYQFVKIVNDCNIISENGRNIAAIIVNLELGAFSARDCTLVVSTSDSRGDLNYYLVT